MNRQELTESRNNIIEAIVLCDEREYYATTPDRIAFEKIKEKLNKVLINFNDKLENSLGEDG